MCTNFDFTNSFSRFHYKRLHDQHKVYFFIFVSFNRTLCNWHMFGSSNDICLGLITFLSYLRFQNHFIIDLIYSPCPLPLSKCSQDQHRGHVWTWIMPLGARPAMAAELGLVHENREESERVKPQRQERA